MSNAVGKSRRRILKGFLLAMAITIAGGAYEAFAPPDLRRLNFIHRYLVDEIVQKWESRINSLPEGSRVLVGFDHLVHCLNFQERRLVVQIFALPPQELGFKGPFHSIDAPLNLVRVEPVSFQAGGVQQNTGVQYCPGPVYADYLKMMAAMKQDLGKLLLIECAYRSPGRQAFDFLLYLARKHEYSLKENSRWNAMPGYSEHNDPINTAVDFINEEGINGDREGQTAADFEALPEYRWLLDQAAKFNFQLSYPRNNALGVTFEPWHWYWKMPQAAGTPGGAPTGPPPDHGPGG